MSRPRRLLLAAALALLPTACGEDAGGDATGEDDGGPVIVATTSIWADVTQQLVCDGLADVRTVIPVGGDPHSYEPSLRDRETLEEADLVVANGLLLEEPLEDTLAAAESGGTPVFRFADEIAAQAPGEFDVDDDDEGNGHEGDGHEHPEGDPHVWFDPTLVAAALPALRDAIVAETGLDAERVAACADRYARTLADTDAGVTAALASIPADRRTLVTNHDALGYFAERYDLEILGAVIPSPSTLAETNPADLQALAELIEETGVTAIFAESQHSTDDADALAAAVASGDVEVVTLYTDSLGPPGSGAESYVGLLATDADLIAGALG